jgi:hypothetical protein
MSSKNKYKIKHNFKYFKKVNYVHIFFYLEINSKIIFFALLSLKFINILEKSYFYFKN